MGTFREAVLVILILVAGVAAYMVGYWSGSKYGMDAAVTRFAPTVIESEYHGNCIKTIGFICPLRQCWLEEEGEPEGGAQ